MLKDKENKLIIRNIFDNFYGEIFDPKELFYFEKMHDILNGGLRSQIINVIIPSIPLSKIIDQKTAGLSKYKNLSLEDVFLVTDVDPDEDGDVFVIVNLRLKMEFSELDDFFRPAVDFKVENLPELGFSFKNFEFEEIWLEGEEEF